MVSLFFDDVLMMLFVFNELARKIGGHTKMEENVFSQKRT